MTVCSHQSRCQVTYHWRPIAPINNWLLFLLVVDIGCRESSTTVSFPHFLLNLILSAPIWAGGKKTTFRTEMDSHQHPFQISTVSRRRYTPATQHHLNPAETNRLGQEKDIARSDGDEKATDEQSVTATLCLFGRCLQHCGHYCLSRFLPTCIHVCTTDAGGHQSRFGLLSGQSHQLI